MGKLCLFFFEGNGSNSRTNLERITNRITNDHEQFCARRLDDALPALKDYILSLLASSYVVDTFIKLITQILAVTQVLMVVEFGVMTS